MNYGEVLSKSWKIIWKFKILWLFGILASCGSNGGGGGGGSSSGSSSSNGNGSLPWNGNGSDFNFQLPPEVEGFFSGITNTIENIPVWVWVLIALVFVAFILLVIFLSIMGKSGLVLGASRADEGAENLPFGELWRGALHVFWRQLGFGLLVFAVSMALVLITILPIVLLTIGTFGIGLLCLIPLMCVLIPVGWFIGLVIQQTQVSIVVDDAGIFDALKRAWNSIVAHPVDMLVMALILFLGGAVAGVIIALPFLLIFIPVVIALVAANTAILTGGILVAVIAGLLYLPVMILASGILEAYLTSAWTLTYRRLTGRGVPPAPAVILEPDAALPLQ